MQARLADATGRTREDATELTVSGAVEPEGAYPLAPQQQALWFHNQVFPQSAAYCATFVHEIEGELNEEALVLAYKNLVARHSILRTSFDSERGPVQQLVWPATTWAVEARDLQMDADPLLAAESATRRIASQSPDLRAKSQYRIVLMQKCPTSWAVVERVHHIISDGWSEGLLNAELSAFYAHHAGVDDPLPPGSEDVGQYFQYATEEAARWRAGHEAEAERSFWSDRLDGWPRFLPEIGNRDDERRPERMSHGDELRVKYRAALWAQVQVLAREARASPFMALLAAFAATTAREFGIRRFVVLVPTARRASRHTERTVGYFADLLCIRCDVDTSMRFSELIQAMRAEVLGALDHSHLPFNHIVDAATRGERQQGMPFLQLGFQLHNVPQQPLRLAGCEVTTRQLPTSSARLDVYLSLNADENGLGGTLEFRESSIGQQRAATFLQRFDAALRAVCEDPQVAVETM